MSHSPLSGPRFLGSADAAPAVAPPPLGWTLADGTFIPREERGVHWRRARRGGVFVAYIVDSSGDDCGEERKLPALHTAAQKRAVERELWNLLETMDPQPHAAALRLVGCVPRRHG